MKNRHVNRLEELPRDIPPARDLWPAIAAAIEADRATVVPQVEGARRRAWLPAAGLAASVMLVAIGVLIGRSFAPSATPVATHASGAQHPAVVPAALQRDAEYQRQREQLMGEVQVRLQAMPAAERDKVMASLATLRRSIAEIEAALGRDPANALLHELLVSSCQEEMRALTAVRDSGRQEI
jgi:hypothetical protein